MHPTRRSLARAAVTAALAATLALQGLALVAAPGLAEASLDLPTPPQGWIRLFGAAQVVVAALVLRRDSRSLALLLAAGAMALPAVAILIEAQPILVAATVVLAAVALCRRLDRQEREAAWQGVPF